MSVIVYYFITLKKSDRNRIEAFEMWCWRKMLSISWQEHYRRLFKMTAGARFQSPSEWPKATRGKVWRGGVSPSEVVSGEGGCAPPQKIFWLKLMHSGEILTLL